MTKISRILLYTAGLGLGLKSFRVAAAMHFLVTPSPTRQSALIYPLIKLHGRSLQRRDISGPRVLLETPSTF